MSSPPPYTDTRVAIASRLTVCEDGREPMVMFRRAPLRYQPRSSSNEEDGSFKSFVRSSVVDMLIGAVAALVLMNFRKISLFIVTFLIDMCIFFVWAVVRPSIMAYDYCFGFHVREALIAYLKLLLENA